jgi:hypothetical protein
MPEDYNKAWAVNMLPFKNWVEATYGSFYIGGVWDSLVNGSILKTIYDWSDGIHLNQAGNNEVYEALVASDKLSGGVTLPVKLYSFEARKSGDGKVFLQWMIDDPRQVQRFTVMKSKDGSVFTELARVASNRNSYVDDHVAEGNNYYRLKIAETDGTVTYSKIALVVNREKSVNITAFQSLQPGELVLSANALHNTNMNWEIVDVAGKKISAGNARLIKGTNTLTLPVHRLNRGLWLLVIYPQDELPEVLLFTR